MICFSMTPLTIQILEFVLAQPAHKLPVIFTPEKSPLSECAESPEDIFQEVLRLEKENLIEAIVVRDVISKPQQVQIRYIPLKGRVYLNDRHSKIQEKNPFRNVFLWGTVAIVILVAVILSSFGGNIADALRLHRHESPQKVISKP